MIGRLKNAEREMKRVSLSLGIPHYLKLICVRERVREWIRRVAVKAPI